MPAPWISSIGKHLFQYRNICIHHCIQSRLSFWYTPQGQKNVYKKFLSGGLLYKFFTKKHKGQS